MDGSSSTTRRRDFVLSLTALALGALALWPGLSAADALWPDPAPTGLPADADRLTRLIAQVAERVRPALVEVHSGGARPSAPDGSETRGVSRRTAGSGFVIHPDGLILTNAHVARAEPVWAHLADGRRVAARIVGRDERIDLALLRVDAGSLPALRAGDSGAVRVGELVLALGHPFAGGQTVSFGIVSRRGAGDGDTGPGFDLIQTDAAVNPGNSGGPLVNLAGDVVGITTLAARNGSIGFAVPTHVARRAIGDLVALGRVRWPWLGVAAGSAADSGRGIRIEAVLAGQPAARAGLRAGDVVVAIDGQPVPTLGDFRRAVAALPIGLATVHEVVRGDTAVALEVTAGECPPGLGTLGAPGAPALY
jgi:serine protease Do